MSDYLTNDPTLNPPGPRAGTFSICVPGFKSEEIAQLTDDEKSRFLDAASIAAMKSMEESFAAWRESRA